MQLKSIKTNKGTETHIAWIVYTGASYDLPHSTVEPH